MIFFWKLVQENNAMSKMWFLWIDNTPMLCSKICMGTWCLNEVWVLFFEQEKRLSTTGVPEDHPKYETPQTGLYVNRRHSVWIRRKVGGWYPQFSTYSYRNISVLPVSEINGQSFFLVRKTQFPWHWFYIFFLSCHIRSAWSCILMHWSSSAIY